MALIFLQVWVNNCLVEPVKFTYRKLNNKGLESGWEWVSGFSSGLNEYLQHILLSSYLSLNFSLRISLLQIPFLGKIEWINYPQLHVVNDLKVLYVLLKKSYREQTAKQPLPLNKVNKSINAMFPSYLFMTVIQYHDNNNLLKKTFNSCFTDLQFLKVRSGFSCGGTWQ